VYSSSHQCSRTYGNGGRKLKSRRDIRAQQADVQLVGIQLDVCARAVGVCGLRKPQGEAGQYEKASHRGYDGEGENGVADNREGSYGQGPKKEEEIGEANAALQIP
jgi:hypothetical protein